MALLVQIAGWGVIALAGPQAYFGLSDEDGPSLYGASLLLLAGIITILLTGHIPNA